MNCREAKQAEFLCESLKTMQKVQSILINSLHKPTVEIKNEWYY